MHILRILRKKKKQLQNQPGRNLKTKKEDEEGGGGERCVEKPID